MFAKRQKGLVGTYSILTVVFMLLSVVVSVLLVKTNQDIRDLAGSPCFPDGCQEAYCDTSSGSEIPKCKTCENGTWGGSSPCGHPEVCGDPDNPNDNSAKNLGGCTYTAPQPKCGDGTCSDGENCDPQSDHYCIADCACPTLPPLSSQDDCPTDVTGYVSQSGSLQSGYHNCNGDSWCLVLNLPSEYSACTYVAEAYTDLPQDCGNQEKNLKKRETIGNGGSICFGDFDWGSDCKAQIDIRFNQSGSPAGNLKTYKEVCGGSRELPSPTPTKIIINTPTPTKITTNTPTPTKIIINTPTPTSTPTSTQTPTNTPPPNSTSTPTPVATNTPINTPTATNTPKPGNTSTPVPTQFIAEGPTPTRITLPEAGVDFPAKGLFLLGAIVALFGLLILL